LNVSVSDDGFSTVKDYKNVSINEDNYYRTLSGLENGSYIRFESELKSNGVGSPILDSVRLLERDYSIVDHSGSSPSVKIDSPMNQTYSTSSIDLNVTSSEAVNFTHNVQYRNGTDLISNTTTNENDQDLNITLSGLPNDELTANVYGSDSSGNIGSDSVDFTVLGDTVVQLNDSVVINQTGNNAYINVTDSFNVSNLTVYSDATNFGGINWSIAGDLSNRIDVKLSYFNDDNVDDTYLANYSIADTVGNSITSTFVPRPVDSVYQVTKNGSFFKQVQSDTSNVLDYGFEVADEAYTSFTVKRTDQFRPEINRTLYRLDERSGLERMEFVLWSRGANDIASSSGPGTRVEFSNTSMKYDVSLPVSGTYSVTDFPGLTRNRDVDVSKSASGIVEDNGFSHTLSSQRRLSDLNISIGDVPGIDYVWNSSLGGDFNGSVSRQSTEQLSDSSTGDFLDETEYSFDVVDSEVTLGFNYTGAVPLEVNNTVSNGFTGVDTTGAITAVNQCSQVNNTAVDITGNGLENFTVGQNCNPGSIGNPAQTITNDSVADERIYYNSTDMVINTNKTENTQIAIRADKTDLKNPDKRDADSLKAYVEGISSEGNSELNVSDTGSFFRVTVGTGFQASSLHTDDSDWSVTYTLSGDNTTVIGGGGGGGGTPTSDETTVYFGSQQSVEETVSAAVGGTTVKNISVFNTREAEVTAQLEVPDSGFCRYIEVQETLSGDEFGSDGSYSLPAATPGPLTDSPRSETQVGLRFDIPNRSVLNEQGVDEFSCSLDTSSSYGVAEELDLIVNEEFSLTNFIDLFTDEFCISIPSANDFGEGVDSNEFCLPVYVWLLLGVSVLFGVYVLGKVRDWW